MKTKYAFIVLTGLLFGLSACKKGDLVNPPSGSIVGKWFVQKEEIKEISGGVAKALDTVYNASAFTTHDYFQFNQDGTAVVSTSGDFTISGEATFSNGAGDVIYGGNTYTYTVSGSLLTLTSTFLHPTPNLTPTGPETDTILLLNGSNLILEQSTGSGSSPEVTTITYYTKATGAN
jgi:hypothetical protein